MRLRFWLDNSRKIALPQSALPCMTAMVLCIGQEGFVWWLALPVLLGVCAAHLGMNLADDYFDFKHDSRVRSEICSTSVRARMEKCHYLLSGEASLHQLGIAICCFLGFAFLMGIVVLVAQWLLHGWQAAMGIVLYAALGLFFGLEYSGKPLELGFHGLGELVIGLLFGPLNMLGVQAAMTGQLFSWQMLAVGVAVGCLVINIVYVHSVMEVNADATLGKMTFARLLNERRDGSVRRNGNFWMLFFIAVFAVVPFVLLGVGIALRWWSLWYLLTLLTLPMSIFLIYSTHRFVHNLPRCDQPQWWMGPMGNWQAYVEAGIDWFLFRWILARNICTFFCLIMMIVHLFFRSSTASLLEVRSLCCSTQNPCHVGLIINKFTNIQIIL